MQKQAFLWVIIGLAHNNIQQKKNVIEQRYSPYIVWLGWILAWFILSVLTLWSTLSIFFFKGELGFMDFLKPLFVLSEWSDELLN